MKFFNELWQEIPVYDRERGIEFVKGFINERLGKNLPTLTLLAAYSSAGKGVISDALDDGSARTLILRLDDYYHGKSWMDRERISRPCLNWDHPEAVELSLVSRHITTLRSDKPIMKPTYQKTTSERSNPEPIYPSPSICAEGIHAFHEESLREMADLKIFVHATKHTRLIRRLFRCQQENWSPSGTLSYVMNIAEPMAEQFISPMIQYADIVIVNELIPELECQRANMFQEQFKFRGTKTPEEIRKLGGEYLLSAVQIDRYYRSSDYDPTLSDEIVRIRQEGNIYRFSNKGPKQGFNQCERPKFEFPISSQVACGFPHFYGHEIFKIEKHRTLYAMDGIIIAVDSNVVKYIDDVYIILGDFIEVRAANCGTSNVEKLRQVVHRLGLSMTDAIVKAYGDI